MQSRPIVMTLLLATILIASTPAGAADKKPSKQPAASMPGMEKMDMDHGMMQGGMMQGGMMDMMNGCRQMMNSSMMPRLPAGNEKLELQMHAEMMQKMGEILGRYADKIKDEKRDAP